MVHNGNVTNYGELRDELTRISFRRLTSLSDVEPILNVFAEELARARSHRFTPEAVFRAVRGVYRKVKGSYSAAGLIQDKGIFAFRDPFGIKPLVFGRRHGEICFASESVTLDRLGFRNFRDVLPGEAVFADTAGRVSTRLVARAKRDRAHTPCIFEYVYFARPDSVMDGIEVYEARLRLGESLARAVMRKGIRPDAVCAVPDTARAAASRLAAMIKVPLTEGLMKNRYIQRTFIMPGQKNRALSVRQKMNPVRSQVKGRSVLLVDDSIVRGTTSREIVQMVRDAGAREVHLAVTAPPLRFPCVYGIDMMTRGEFIARRHSVDKVRQLIGSDSLTYQTHDDLVAAVSESDSRRRFCTACFCGRYPTGVNRRDLARLESERTRWKSPATG